MGCSCGRCTAAVGRLQVGVCLAAALPGAATCHALLSCHVFCRNAPPQTHTRHVHTAVRPTRHTRVSSLLLLPGLSHSQVLHAIGMGRLLQLPSDMPPLLRDLLAACMSKDPSERYMRTDLAQGLAAHTHTPCCNSSAWQCCACSRVMPVDRSDAACMWSGAA